jgi:tripartite-type tricarboxylate transporter receptor subunit TctC
LRGVRGWAIIAGNKTIKARGIAVKLIRYACLGLICFALGIGAASAQQAPYPNRTVKVLVPYNPGGATDIVARIVLDEMRQSLGQTFIVENKAAAYGIVAIEEVARSKPDGYTLMIGNITTNSITPVLHQKELHIDYATQIVAISEIAVISNFVLATGAFPANSLKEMIDYVKAHPGQVKYASVGVGSYPHIDMLMLMKATGMDMVHVPFVGGAGGDLMANLVNGDVQLGMLNVATFGPIVRTGKLKAFAVTSKTRQPDYPDVPTMTELGFPGIGSDNWQGLFGPAGLSPDIVAALRKALQAALKSDHVRQVFATNSITAVTGGTQEQFIQFVRHEGERFSDTIRDSHLVVE